MEDEHCAMYGHDEPFETTNYGVRTCPRQEYEITTGKKHCTAKDMLDRNGKRVRDVRTIEELQQHKAAQKAGLVEEELIAVVCHEPGNESVGYCIDVALLSSPSRLTVDSPLCIWCRCFTLGPCSRYLPSLKSRRRPAIVPL
jgi:hypothetical protein